MSVVNQASIIAAMGASGSGKSAFVKQCLAGAAPPRLMIWDTMDEYGDFARRVLTLQAMVNAIKASPTFALRYVPSGAPDELVKRFDVFCSVAFAIGKVCLVVEELQTVTKPAWAPAGWSNCTLRGRHKGLSIFGISQRPASVDKNFFSNATMVRCGRLNFAEDVRTMDSVMGLGSLKVCLLDSSVGTVAHLKPLQYVQRDMASGEVSAGILAFEPKKPRESQKKVSTEGRKKRSP